jgi:hypothetical protein
MIPQYTITLCTDTPKAGYVHIHWARKQMKTSKAKTAPKSFGYEEVLNIPHELIPKIDTAKPTASAQPPTSTYRTATSAAHSRHQPHTTSPLPLEYNHQSPFKPTQ